MSVFLGRVLTSQIIRKRNNLCVEESVVCDQKGLRANQAFTGADTRVSRGARAAPSSERLTSTGPGAPQTVLLET